MELALLVILAGAAALAVRTAVRGRAARRSTGLAEQGSARFPCRLSWEAGTGRKAFTYGKIEAGAAEGLRFIRRGGGPLALPRALRVHTEPSWRTGLVLLRYTAAGKGDVRILLSEADAVTVAGLLRGEGAGAP
ncbi:hypothetical protein [Streptomyces sp. NPDC085932]|uniref:hypothetical protein n=1 Tax=Streptomyces sp. NPDC085932 TaxID=3365741 RepID=UPI0037CF753B